MRLATPLLLISLLLCFGCLEQQSLPSQGAERLAYARSTDIDNDSIADYAAYTFSQGGTGSDIALRRTMTVATETTASYTSLTPNLGTLDVLTADQSLEEFSKSKAQSESDCSQQIGLGKVVCSDVATCSRLCSGASLKCKKIASAYGDVLAASMISYTRAMGDLGSLILDARRMVVRLDSAGPDEKAAYLDKTRKMVAGIAEANANPIYSQQDVALCTYSDYGVQDLLDAAKKIGTYDTVAAGYRYTMLISAKPQAAGNGTLGTEISGISLTDHLPRSVVGKPEYISSIQEMSVAENGSDVAISWNSASTSVGGYLFAYSFTSTEPPERVLASLRMPSLTVKRINLTALAPTERLFQALLGVVKNYYVALALALAFTIIALILACNALIFCASLVAERTLTAAFKRAFGRSGVTWKTDAVLATIALGAGAYVCLVIAVQPATTPTFLESFDFLVSNGTGMVGLTFVLIGTLLLYLVIENLVKIAFLEAAYGKAIRQEKDTYLANVTRLRDRLKELEALIEKAGLADLETTHEYDVLVSVPPERLDSLARNMTVQSKTLLEEYTGRVDGAIKGLGERKKAVDENWPKWSEGIGKLLDEHGSVHTSLLEFIPVHLRVWALGRYVKEKGDEGIILEHDTISRKKLGVDRVVREMVEHGLVKGAVVLGQEKVQYSEFADAGGATVKSVLALKLMAYMNTLARNLSQKEPTSLLVVGGALAIVFMRAKGFEFFLFVTKDKFSEAVEHLRAKIKMVEE